MAVLVNGSVRKEFPVSTSKFGIGNRPKSFTTPLGRMAVSGKIGHNARVGTVFKGGVKTGEVIPINAAGRDPIVTRILRLRGLEAGNANTESRAIYIHGTPEERNIGRPASYGCIRMKSADVINLFNIADVGTHLEVVASRLKTAIRAARRMERGGTMHTRHLTAAANHRPVMVTRAYGGTPRHPRS